MAATVTTPNDSISSGAPIGWWTPLSEIKSRLKDNDPAVATNARFMYRIVYMVPALILFGLATAYAADSAGLLIEKNTLWPTDGEVSATAMKIAAGSIVLPLSAGYAARRIGYNGGRINVLIDGIRQDLPQHKIDDAARKAGEENNIGDFVGKLGGPALFTTLGLLGAANAGTLSEAPMSAIMILAGTIWHMNKEWKSGHTRAYFDTGQSARQRYTVQGAGTGINI